MASYCASCGAKLPFLRKLGGQALCQSCAEEEKRAREAAEEEYEALLSALVAVSTPTSDIESRLPTLAQQAALTPARIHDLHAESFRAYMEQVLADDCLTAQEEAHMLEIAGVLGIEQAMFESEFKGMMPRLVVARVNDGRLPAIDEPHIMLRKDEIAHLETNADLVKDVTPWESRGYGGVSFRVAKGVRFHTGAARGRSVVAGTEFDIKDEGILSVTSERAVHVGTRETIEMPYKKLVNLSVFEDGIQFHVSNRKNAPMFRLEQGLGEAVAAVVNAASQEVALPEALISEEGAAQAGLEVVGEEIDAGCGQFGLEVVGESQYQPAVLRASKDARRKGERRIIRVSVEREPTNPYDPKAVQVISTYGETLGYLPRTEASSYQKPLMEFEKAGLKVTCAASVYGGDAERPTLGLYLDLLFPKKLKAAIPPPRKH